MIYKLCYSYNVENTVPNVPQIFTIADEKNITDEKGAKHVTDEKLCNMSLMRSYATRH